MPIASNRFGSSVIEEGAAEAAFLILRSQSSDLAQLAGLHEPDEFVPFGMRQPNGVRILADSDALVGDLNFRARRASWA